MILARNHLHKMGAASLPDKPYCPERVLRSRLGSHEVILVVQPKSAAGERVATGPVYEYGLVHGDFFGIMSIGQRFFAWLVFRACYAL